MFVCSTEEPMYLIANGSLITRVPGDEFFMKDGGVVVVGSRIAEVGTTAELVSKYPRAEFIDACGGIIMPGFIDAHTRFYSSLTCGFDLPVSERAEYYEFCITAAGPSTGISRLTLSNVRICFNCRTN